MMSGAINVPWISLSAAIAHALYRVLWPAANPRGESQYVDPLAGRGSENYGGRDFGLSGEVDPAVGWGSENYGGRDFGLTGPGFPGLLRPWLAAKAAEQPEAEPVDLADHRAA